MSQQSNPEQIPEQNHAIRYPDVLDRTPTLTSYESGWKSISLEYQHQPKGGTPEILLDHYVIGIHLGQSIDLEFILEGHLQKGMMFNGAIMLCPMERSHRFHWDQEIHALSLNLQTELLSRNAAELLGVEQFELLPQFLLYDGLIHQIGLALKAALEAHQPGGSLYAENLANTLAVHLLRYYSSQNHRSIRCIDGLPTNQLKQVIDYIQAHLHQDLELRELATIVQLSEYHFSRSFKKATGLSPHQYVIQQRVERAKQLLQDGRMSISEVAITCGFTHQSHLHRHFKRLTGTTPKMFLKS